MAWILTASLLCVLFYANLPIGLSAGGATFGKQMPPPHEPDAVLINVPGKGGAPRGPPGGPFPPAGGPGVFGFPGFGYPMGPPFGRPGQVPGTGRRPRGPPPFPGVFNGPGFFGQVPQFPTGGMHPQGILNVSPGGQGDPGFFRAPYIPSAVQPGHGGLQPGFTPGVPRTPRRVHSEDRELTFSNTPGVFTDGNGGFIPEIPTAYPGDTGLFPNTPLGAYPDNRGEFFPETPETYPGNRRFFPETPAAFPDNRGFVPERPPAFPDNRGFFPERPPVFPDNKGFFPEAPAAFPGNRGSFPETPAAFPDNRGYFPETPAAFPDNGGYFPETPRAYPDKRERVFPETPEAYPDKREESFPWTLGTHPVNRGFFPEPPRAYPDHREVYPERPKAYPDNKKGFFPVIPRLHPENRGIFPETPETNPNNRRETTPEKPGDYPGNTGSGHDLIPGSYFPGVSTDPVYPQDPGFHLNRRKFFGGEGREVNDEPIYIGVDIYPLKARS